MNKVIRSTLVCSAIIAAETTTTAYQARADLIGAFDGSEVKGHLAKVAESKAKPQSSSSQAPIPKPPGWSSNNSYLGRWQGQSRAGLAVIGVLSVEPNRVSWGNTANGSCNSDYAVERLPLQRNGTYPDPLVHPSEPTDLAYSVTQLTLRPKPCKTGDAMLQLSMPLDGSQDLQVNTYNAKGQVTGIYGTFRPIRP
jgi:hypothetical protein